MYDQQSSFVTAQTIRHWTFDPNVKYQINIIAETEFEKIGFLLVDDIVEKFPTAQITLSEDEDIVPITSQTIYELVFGDTIKFTKTGCIITDYGKNINIDVIFNQFEIIIVELDRYQDRSIVIGFDKANYEIENLYFYYTYVRKQYYDAINIGTKFMDKITWIRHKLRRKLITQYYHISRLCKLSDIKNIILYTLNLVTNITKIEVSMKDLLILNLLPTNIIEDFATYLMVQEDFSEDIYLLADVLNASISELFKKYEYNVKYMDLIAKGNTLINQWNGQTNKLWNLCKDDTFTVREFPLSYIDFMSNCFYKDEKDNVANKEKLILLVLSNDIKRAIINISFETIDEQTSELTYYMDPPIQIYRKLKIELLDAKYIHIEHIENNKFKLGNEEQLI
jgi:hypothetical protein